MLQSKLFTKTLREDPRGEASANARFLIRGGFIDRLSAGIYSFLPLGFKVLSKIENIIREEMNGIGGQEILMPALHPREMWEITGRWKVDEMFKLKAKAGKEYGLGWTHEEIITPLLKKFALSYKDFPAYVYQIQTKMRDELRAKSGILRGKEFVMKDLYSFHTDTKNLDEYYEKVKMAYFKIFQRCGLRKKTYLTLASGGSFSKFSHEFQTITSAGEDIIYICENCDLAINKEIKKEHPICPQCKKKKFKEEKAIETANIFKLGSKYSEPFEFRFIGKDGKKNLVVMGCYGIGLTRLMGTIAEICRDDNGIIWPKEVAPFAIHLICLKTQNLKIKSQIKKTADKIYNALQKNKIEVLYDEREDKSPGEKFADSDLMGIPKKIIISERTIKKNSVEIKERSKKNSELVKIAILKKLKF